jgi:hypothetical protein
MAGAKFLKCDCTHCGGRIEFPADGIGTTVPCPHCGSETELTLATPEIASPVSSRSVKWAIAGLIILMLGVAGAFIALNMARKILRQPPDRVINQRPASVGRSASSEAKWKVHTNQFSSSPVKVEARPGSAVIYASGTLRNALDTQRFGVSVELEIFNDAGEKVGTAQDYRDVMEARGEWNFRALVVSRNAAVARVSSIREQL